MPIKVTCSNCGGVLHAPDDAGGKKGRCPTCGNVLPIPADSPRVPQAKPPEAPLPSGPRPQSFGDMAMGVPVSPPAPVTAARSSGLPEMPRVSAPSLAETKPEPRKPAKIPPPPAFDAPKKSGPFANASGEVSDGTIRAWKKTRSGLGWIRAATLFLMIPCLFFPVLRLVIHFTGPLTFIKPQGFLNLDGLDGANEFAWLGAGIPFLLGLFCLTIGRLGFARVPTMARARGIAQLASLSTVLVLAGVLAMSFPSVMVIIQDKLALFQLFDLASNEGLMQRLGIALIISSWIAGEFWFSAALGRVGTSLQSDKTAARVTRYQMVWGVIIIALITTGSLNIGYPFDPYWSKMMPELNMLVRQGWDQHLQPQWDKLDSQKLVAMNGAAILAVLVLGFGYLRMIGAGRRAIREWLDQHA